MCTTSYNPVAMFIDLLTKQSMRSSFKFCFSVNFLTVFLLWVKLLILVLCSWFLFGKKEMCGSWNIVSFLNFIKSVLRLWCHIQGGIYLLVGSRPNSLFEDHCGYVLIIQRHLWFWIYYIMKYLVYTWNKVIWLTAWQISFSRSPDTCGP